MDQLPKLRCLLYLTLLGQKVFFSNEWNLPLSFNFLFLRRHAFNCIHIEGHCSNEKKNFSQRNISLMKINDSTSYAYFQVRNWTGKKRNQVRFIKKIFMLTLKFCLLQIHQLQSQTFNYFAWDSSELNNLKKWILVENLSQILTNLPSRKLFVNISCS